MPRTSLLPTPESFSNGNKMNKPKEIITALYHLLLTVLGMFLAGPLLATLAVVALFKKVTQNQHKCMLFKCMCFQGVVCFETHSTLQIMLLMSMQQHLYIISQISVSTLNPATENQCRLGSCMMDHIR